MPEISIIMIFLNPGEFFREAIESVRAQTFTHWELLLVDDGSTDGSTVIAQRYSEEYSGRIKYVSHPQRENRGMSASRSLGLRHAAGEFVALLDSDDVWDPNYLAAQITQFTAWPDAAAVFANTRVWFSWTGSPADEQRDQQRHSGNLTNLLVPPRFLIPLWLRQEESTPATCSVLLRVATARKHIFDDSFNSIFEDQVFFFKVALHETVFVSDQTLSYYRQHSASSCHREQLAGAYHPSKPNLAERKFLSWFREYLLRTNMGNQTIEEALQFRLKEYDRKRGRLLRQACSFISQGDWRQLRWHKIVKNVRRVSALSHWPTDGSTPDAFDKGPK